MAVPARKVSKTSQRTRRAHMALTAKATTTCPNCGAHVDVNSAGTCEYCGSKIIGNNTSWVISKKICLRQTNL